MMPARDTSPAMRWLENTLLFIVLGLIVLRAMIIESPHIDQPQTRLFLSSEIVSLLTSTMLLACVGLWLFVSILCNRFHWRKTGFGVAVGVFIFAGYIPNTANLKGIIKLNARDEILVDQDMKTSLSGVFAAGDCIQKKYRQVTTAVADGTIASLSAAEFLRS